MRLCFVVPLLAFLQTARAQGAGAIVFLSDEGVHVLRLESGGATPTQQPYLVSPHVCRDCGGLYVYPQENTGAGHQEAFFSDTTGSAVILYSANLTPADTGGPPQSPRTICQFSSDPSGQLTATRAAGVVVADNYAYFSAYKTPGWFVVRCPISGTGGTGEVFGRVRSELPGGAVAVHTPSTSLYLLWSDAQKIPRLQSWDYTGTNIGLNNYGTTIIKSEIEALSPTAWTSPDDVVDLGAMSVAGDSIFFVVVLDAGGGQPDLPARVYEIEAPSCTTCLGSANYLETVPGASSNLNRPAAATGMSHPPNAAICVDQTGWLLTSTGAALQAQELQSGGSPTSTVQLYTGAASRTKPLGPVAWMSPPTQAPTVSPTLSPTQPPSAFPSGKPTSHPVPITGAPLTPSVSPTAPTS
eukprot:Hpha_TRINITY_DN10355_c0_g2::TRINITY_DN10355_c0_g2_i1::g.116217::m.116217